jgi:hypothetical protein
MLRNTGFALILGFTSTVANAATIFQATDGDINIADTTGGGLFAIFDNEASLDAGTPLLEIIKGDRILVDNLPPATTNLENVRTGFDLDITDSNFVFGAKTSSGSSSWIIGEGAELYFAGSNQWGITFAGIAPELKVVVDVQPIPVPAAVWLFGSGLLALAGVARRKRLDNA